MRHWLRVRVDYCVTPAGGSSRIRFDSGSDRSILSILSCFFISIIDTETLGVERAGRGVEREGWKVLMETGLDEFENIGFPGVRMRFDMAEVVIPFELGLRNTVPLEKGVEETVWKIRGGEVESRGRDTLGDKESLVTPEATPSDRIICVPGVMGVPGGGPPL